MQTAIACVALFLFFSFLIIAMFRASAICHGRVRDEPLPFSWLPFLDHHSHDSGTHSETNSWSDFGGCGDGFGGGDGGGGDGGGGAC